MDEKAIKSIRIDQYATLFTDDSIECPECNADTKIQVIRFTNGLISEQGQDRLSIIPTPIVQEFGLLFLDFHFLICSECDKISLKENELEHDNAKLLELNRERLLEIIGEIYET